MGIYDNWDFWCLVDIINDCYRHDEAAKHIEQRRKGRALKDIPLNELATIAQEAIHIMSK